MAVDRSPNTPLRPVDASSLIVLDGAADDPSVLMGRRSARHAFMPSVYVFPGGKVDRADGRVVSSLVPPHDEARLRAGLGSRATDGRVRAIVGAALRETLEETGYALRTDCAAGSIRYVARAITPPGRNRRFDARFFACRSEVLQRTDSTPTDELEDLRWIALTEAGELPLARITKVILDELRTRLRVDPLLGNDMPIPHHRMSHGAFVRLLD